MPRKNSQAASSQTSATPSSAAGPKQGDGVSNAQGQSKPEKGWSGPKRRITITDTPPGEAEKSSSKKEGHGNSEPEPHPVYEFIRDVNPDLTMPIRAEDALGMESDLDNEMERELIAEADIEPWKVRIMKLAWSTEPMKNVDDEYGKFRIDGEAFKAFNSDDPLEIMAFAQATALQSTIFFKLREVGRQNMSPEVEERRYRSIAKLSDSFTKLTTALQQSRRKGAQTVRVHYEHHDHGAVGQTSTRKLTLDRTGSEIDFGVGAKEPVTVEATMKAAETTAEESQPEPAKASKAKGAARGRK